MYTLAAYTPYPHKSLQHLHCGHIHSFLSYLWYSLSILCHCFCILLSICELVHFPHQNVLLLLGLPSLDSNLQLNYINNCIGVIILLMSVCPSSLHTVLASLMSQPSSHTVPQWPSRQTSTRPLFPSPPLSLMLPSLQLSRLLSVCITEDRSTVRYNSMLVGFYQNSKLLHHLHDHSF